MKDNNNQTEGKEMTTKSEVLSAGKSIAARSTPKQQENHAKVLAWISDLSDEKIPAYSRHAEGREAGAVLSYKMLIQIWYKETNVPAVTKN